MNSPENRAKLYPDEGDPNLESTENLETEVLVRILVKGSTIIHGVSVMSVRRGVLCSMPGWGRTYETITLPHFTNLK